MKRFLTILFAFAVSGTMLSAQNVKSVTDSLNIKDEAAEKDSPKTNIVYRKRYRADIELLWSNPNHWGISTSHGYSFGNGLYVGGGAGFYAIMDNTITFYTPVFADIKYSFINCLASPFVSAKAGGLIDITNSGIRTFINPSIGIDIHRFSIKVGYEYQYGCWGFGKDTHNHQIKCGIGFTF